MATHRATYLFAVKEFEDGTPFIAWEPRYDGLTVLPKGLMAFDLPEGTSIDEASEIANYLNQNIAAVAFTPV